MEHLQHPTQWYSTKGVPQGNILGPILFTLYIDPTSDICRKYQISFHSYADDMQNYLSFKPMTSGNKELCRSNLEACISEVWVWMHTNLLKQTIKWSLYSLVPEICSTCVVKCRLPSPMTQLTM